MVLSKLFHSRSSSHKFNACQSSNSISDSVADKNSDSLLLRRADFPYLPASDIYLDSACQSLRPEPVIAALTDYYRQHNSCGERAHYSYAATTDAKVSATRAKVLKYLKKSPRDYFTAFTLNTTYAINLVLNQINPAHFDRIITSDLEHNSPFLATLALSRRTGLPRTVLSRHPDGSIDLKTVDFSRAIVVLNCASNLDGRVLGNLSDLTAAVHAAGGILIVDAAQAMANSPEVLHSVCPDAICFSAHKLYAPSLGGLVVHRRLLDHLEPHFLGGGMVDDVRLDDFDLSADNPEHLSTRFEAGLQAWGEIVALGASLDWLELPTTISAKHELATLAVKLHAFLAKHSKIHLLNPSIVTPTTSFYVEGLDSHLLGSALAKEGIMARTGYFCVHYYLDHVLRLPPLIRFSLGLHNTSADLDKIFSVLSPIL